MAAVGVLAVGAARAIAQEAPPSNPPKGTVLIQSHGEPPVTTPLPDMEKQQDSEATAEQKLSGPEFTDKERSAIYFSSYNLDARFTPATSQLLMRAGLTLRNDSAEPLTRIALQISSTLKWESVRLRDGQTWKPLDIAQHLLDSDVDHTGRVRELVVTLDKPLAPGASVVLDTFYSGTLERSGERLARIGATAGQSSSSDWDGVSADGIALRGYGNVLWYPVATPQHFLGDGASLFQAVGQMKLREQGASMNLQLAVEYNGEPPVAAYFAGLRQPLVAISDDPDAPIAAGHGIAKAMFTMARLGFRLPSLFLVEQKELLVAPLPAGGGALAGGASAVKQSTGYSSSSSIGKVDAPVMQSGGGAELLAVETKDEGALPLLGASAQRIAPVLQRWFGARPLSALTIIDAPGQPFEDGPLVVGSITSLGNSEASVALAHSLAHAWVQTGQPWMDEGLSQFASLLWVEQERGRDAALARLQELLQPLALAEPAVSQGEVARNGQPLIEASDELYYRRKSAAVWWMLRDIVGEDALRQALNAWCSQPVLSSDARSQAEAFEKLLERTSSKDLGWFFQNWVLNDLGLPDLTITDVTPRFLPIGAGHSSGWLVAVTVRNDGAAEVEVPITIRSGTFSSTKRLRIAGFSIATDREIVVDAPTEVVVNDGSIPEVRNTLHTRTVNVRTQ